jgi:hypothetical protein
MARPIYCGKLECAAFREALASADSKFLVQRIVYSFFIVRPQNRSWFLWTMFNMVLLKCALPYCILQKNALNLSFVKSCKKDTGSCPIKSFLLCNCSAGNFEYDARPSEIEHLFSEFGKVERVDMKMGMVPSLLHGQVLLHPKWSPC